MFDCSLTEVEIVLVWLKPDVKCLSGGRQHCGKIQTCLFQVSAVTQWSSELPRGSVRPRNSDASQRRK